VPVSVFYQVWDQPLYTVGGGQIISDALTVCGARNVFADLTLPAPQISLEAVLQRDPEVILTGDARLVSGWNAWPQLKAVKAKHLYAVPDKGLERASGQMIEAVAKLCERLSTDR
jgi:vitamin B12 transport system substrate-binding protein